MTVLQWLLLRIDRTGGVLHQRGDGVRQQDNRQAADRGEGGVFGAFHTAWTATGGHVQKARPGQKQRCRGQPDLGRRGEQRVGQRTGHFWVGHRESFRAGGGRGTL